MSSLAKIWPARGPETVRHLASSVSTLHVDDEWSRHSPHLKVKHSCIYWQGRMIATTYFPNQVYVRLFDIMTLRHYDDIIYDLMTLWPYDPVTIVILTKCMCILVLYESPITVGTGGAPWDWGAYQGAGLMFLSQVSEWKDTSAPSHCGAGLALRTLTPLRYSHSQGSSCHQHHRHLTKDKRYHYHPSPSTLVT